MKLAIPALACALALAQTGVAFAIPPENDTFARALPLFGEEAAATAHNSEASSEPGEPAHTPGAGGRTVWYRWTAPAGGAFVAHTCSSDFDTVLAVYTGDSVEALQRVASDDDSCEDRQSLVRFDAVAGTTYSLVVDGSGGARGRFTLSLSPAGSGPSPRSGGYSGRAGREPVRFTLTPGSTRINSFTVALRLDCARGSLRSPVILSGIRVRGRRFAVTRRVHLRGGGSQRVQLTGTLVAPTRASGTIRASGRSASRGRCRTARTVRWFAALRR